MQLTRDISPYTVLLPWLAFMALVLLTAVAIDFKSYGKAVALSLMAFACLHLSSIFLLIHFLRFIK